jgi:hypothetical protein
MSQKDKLPHKTIAMKTRGFLQKDKRMGKSGNRTRDHPQFRCTAEKRGFTTGITPEAGIIPLDQFPAKTM